MAEKYRLNWERENQRLLDFYRDIRKEHGGEDSDLDNEEFQIQDNLEDLDDQIMKRKRDELEKMLDDNKTTEQMAQLKKEVKLENEMEFELKALNLKDVNFGVKGTKGTTQAFQDITEDTDFREEENKRKKKHHVQEKKKKDIKANTKIAISSTLHLNIDSVKKEAE